MPGGGATEDGVALTVLGDALLPGQLVTSGPQEMTVRVVVSTTVSTCARAVAARAPRPMMTVEERIVGMR